MSPQLSLTYDPRTTGSETWLRQLEAIRLAVNHLGAKEVSFALDISGSMVSDALNERDRKRWAAEWTHVVVAMLIKRGDEAALGLVRQIFEAALEATPFLLDTDAELAAALETLQTVISRVSKRGRR